VRLALLGDSHLAEDVAQEAFVEAYRKLSALREPRAFAGWLRKIVLKHCDRITRKRRRTAAVALEEAMSVAAEGRPDCDGAATTMVS
jgi:RNA polymerase sigma-70 factor (ECF subfamily)